MIITQIQGQENHDNYFPAGSSCQVETLDTCSYNRDDGMQGGYDDMKRRGLIALALCLCLSVFLSPACAEFTFSDERFRGIMTTDNLDAIIEEYELFDGWYWTTRAEVSQDFHGRPETPGWTTSTESSKKAYLKGWYGCRWPIDHVRREAPDRGGYAECFAFAQFIGYLLSGEINPQHNWDFFYNTKASEGLRVGDIVRVEYRKHKHSYHHSAVVYAINGEEILFLQVSGGSGNRISVGKGFSDGNVENVTTLEQISVIPGLKISRYCPPDSE